jgi:protein-S-isoprenylcysteine O-methyltransferase Ste14
MAKNLNRSRIRDTWLVALTTVGVLLFADAYFPDNTLAHEINEYLGMTLTTICALGRIYCTLFIGGVKNAALVTSGPFSVVRNPLYVFSMIGALGIGLISNHLTVLVSLVVVFPVMYTLLVRREEVFLLESFGQEYRDYMQRVPRFIPKFSLYHNPDELVTRPRKVLQAMRDSIMWFAALPLIELLEVVQTWLKASL